MESIKVLGTETACNTTPQSYNGYRSIRLVNNTAGNVLVTRKDSGNNTIGTFTMIANTVVITTKGQTNTLESNTSILAAPAVSLGG